jgi:hypothetical protein
MIAQGAQPILKGEGHEYQHLAQHHVFHRDNFICRFSGIGVFPRALVARALITGRL